MPAVMGTLATRLAGVLVNLPYNKSRKIRVITASILIAALNNATCI